MTKNWFVQLAVSIGTEALPWHFNAQIANPFLNPLFPNTPMPRDPGAVPSVTAAVRWSSDSGDDNIYIVGDAINHGNWGYNNLQWTGLTYYHKFNDQWHISVESYDVHQYNVLNVNNQAALTAFNNGGTPFSPQYMPFNSPFGAQCSNPGLFSCTAESRTFLWYLNYKPQPMDNISWRFEWFDDVEGQRTGTKTNYIETGLGWQHWFSPQIEIRPEFSFYRSLNAMAFNGNPNLGIPANKNTALIGSADIIIHF